MARRRKKDRVANSSKTQTTQAMKEHIRAIQTGQPLSNIATSYALFDGLSAEDYQELNADKKMDEKSKMYEEETYTEPVLEFNPQAWSKLIYLRDIGNTEVGFFGLTSLEYPLYVYDIIMPKQKCTACTVEFEEDDLANFSYEMSEKGYHPAEFHRIWIHTHPGNSAEPSSTDWKTWHDIFGRNDWAIMFILAQNNATFCRLSTRVNLRRKQPEPGSWLPPDGYVRLQKDIKCSINWYANFSQSSVEDWDNEYRRNVSVVHSLYSQGKSCYVPGYSGYEGKSADDLTKSADRYQLSATKDGVKITDVSDRGYAWQLGYRAYDIAGTTLESNPYRGFSPGSQPSMAELNWKAGYEYRQKEVREKAGLPPIEVIELPIESAVVEEQLKPNDVMQDIDLDTLGTTALDIQSEIMHLENLEHEGSISSEDVERLNALYKDLEDLEEYIEKAERAEMLAQALDSKYGYLPDSSPML